MREGDNATDHLVGLTRVNAEVRGDLDCGVELCVSDVLQHLTCLGKSVKSGGVVLLSDCLLVFSDSTHVACEI